MIALQRHTLLAEKLWENIFHYGFAEITVHSEKFKYIWLFSRLFVTLASPNLLSLDNKNKKSVFCFVLFSLIRNFAV